MMRLRQIALVTPNLRGAEHEICDQLSLEVCYRDPGLSHFGLRHGLYAIGDQILEIVAPKQQGTTAGRFLERRGGEGGYMVLLQTDELQQHKTRVENNGMRIVHDGKVDAHGASIRGIHLHPKDVGGAILSLDQAEPAESWLWAGNDWQYHSTNKVVTDIVAIDIQADEPESMAERWAQAIGRPANDGTISLDDATIRFVSANDGRGDGLAAADLLVADRSRAGQSLNICGFLFRLV
tara:strand:+ start:621 stop:1331 length:711 start_codon:yes stop_codon:yes gene_type:complete